MQDETWGKEEKLAIDRAFENACEHGSVDSAAVAAAAEAVCLYKARTAALGGTMTAKRLEALVSAHRTEAALPDGDPVIDAMHKIIGELLAHSDAQSARIAELVGWFADVTEVLCGERPVGVMPETTLAAARSAMSRIAELTQQVAELKCDVGVESASREVQVKKLTQQVEDVRKTRDGYATEASAMQQRWQSAVRQVEVLRKGKTQAIEQLIAQHEELAARRKTHVNKLVEQRDDWCDNAYKAMRERDEAMARLAAANLLGAQLSERVDELENRLTDAEGRRDCAEAGEARARKERDAARNAGLKEACLEAVAPVLALYGIGPALRQAIKAAIKGATT